MIEFKAWPKIPRLFRDIEITEKLDGTNAAIHVIPVEAAEAERASEEGEPFRHYVHDFPASPTGTVQVAAQSRTRLIYPGKQTDNYGFAQWVSTNGRALANSLGLGVHYGEWWGGGIQRRYGRTGDDRTFSLFNTRWVRQDVVDWGLGLDVVPVLYRGPNDTVEIQKQLQYLASHGSWAAPGYANPEGVVVRHQVSGHVYKVLLENDQTAKTAQ